MGNNSAGVRFESFTAMTMEIYDVCIVHITGSNSSQKPAASMFRVEVQIEGGEWLGRI